MLSYLRRGQCVVSGASISSPSLGANLVARLGTGLGLWGVLPERRIDQIELFFTRFSQVNVA
jgi:hypothetical protein